MQKPRQNASRSPRLFCSVSYRSPEVLSVYSKAAGLLYQLFGINGSSYSSKAMILPIEYGSSNSAK